MNEERGSAVSVRPMTHEVIKVALLVCWFIQEDRKRLLRESDYIRQALRIKIQGLSSQVASSPKKKKGQENNATA